MISRCWASMMRWASLARVGVLSLTQLSLRHRDSLLMMSDHHLQEHPVERVAGRLPEPLHLVTRHHAGHRAAGAVIHHPHAPHGAVHRGHRGVPGTQPSAHQIDFRLLRGLDTGGEILHLR